MNRRMPNGTSCGVGGRRERSRLLPDARETERREAPRYLHLVDADFDVPAETACRIETA